PRASHPLHRVPPDLRDVHEASLGCANLFDQKIRLVDSGSNGFKIGACIRLVMARPRRSLIKIGADLAVDFANIRGVGGDPAGGLESWRDLVDFIELHGAVSRPEGVLLRAMGERDAGACADALDRARVLRATVRDALGAMAGRRAIRAEWIAAVNQALVWGAGSTRLERRAGGWQLGFV